MKLSAILKPSLFFSPFSCAFLTISRIITIFSKLQPSFLTKPPKNKQKQAARTRRHFTILFTKNRSSYKWPTTTTPCLLILPRPLSAFMATALTPPIRSRNPSNQQRSTANTHFLTSKTWYAPSISTKDNRLYQNAASEPYCNMRYRDKLTDQRARLSQDPTTETPAVLAGEVYLQDHTASHARDGSSHIRARHLPSDRFPWSSVALSLI